jgi:dual oxidase
MTPSNRRAVCLGITIFYWTALIPPICSREVERHPNDGWFNNLIHPDWGVIDSHLLRRSLTNYSDGVYLPSGPNRPNPLEISKIAFSGPNGFSSVRKRNTLLVFFGQQLVEEILDAQRPGCPVEFFNIPVPKNHLYNPEHKDNLELPFQRARFDQSTGYSANNPRQQINEITPYIDGSLVYSASKATEDALREFKGGRLWANTTVIEDSFPVVNDIRLPLANPPPPRDHVLRPVSRFRRYGNPRTHENPFMLTLATIWFRYHNYIADQLHAKNSSMDDEELFFAAKRRVIAQYQKIVMYEWLPHWLQITENATTFDIKGLYPYKGGSLNKYAGYDPNVHPGISTEFQAAAMRFGHTLIPAGVVTKSVDNQKCAITYRDVKSRFTNSNNTDPDSNVRVKGLRLCNTFWVPQEALEFNPGIDSIIRGLVTTRTAMEDNIIVSDIRENVFGPLEWSRRDLGALNIQRGRDEGLPSYNDIREAYGLPRQQSWSEINPMYPDILNQLRELYGNTSAPDDLDLFPGGLLETTYDGPGPLFRAILLDQFLRIRHGDRFWYENDKNGIYTKEEVEEIENTMFYDVINNVTRALRNPTLVNVTRDEIFYCSSATDPNGCECNDPVVDDEDLHEVCAPLKHYNYFDGSEASFVLTIIAIILSVPVTIAILMCMSYHRKRTLNANGSTPGPKFETGPNLFYATEWVGRSTHGFLTSRDVKINLDESRLKILVANMKGQVVRMIDLRRKLRESQHNSRTSIGSSRASATRSSDKGHKLLMVAVPGEIDLVLHFPTQNDRDSAFSQLLNFFKKHNWDFHEGPVMAEHIMWREATTVDQRKELLAKFFKSALADLSNDGDSNSRPEVLEEILTTQLTRTEFADALGLQPQSLFVRNMFLLVDSSGDGFISFDEFKAYFGILSSGKPEQKAEMFFKMFDTSRSNKLSREDYKKMIMVLFELNEADNSKLDMDAMVDTVFKQAGKSNQNFLTFQDFKKILFSDTADIWKSAVLNLEVAGQTTALGYRKTVNLRAKSFFDGYTSSMRPTSMVSFSNDVKLPSELEKAPKGKFQNFMQKWTRYIDNHRRQIFWVSLYTLTVVGIFVERCYYYSVEREHAGLRRLAGYGVSITRGAASAQMFTYASLLVTMSRNTLTFFRETFLHRFIPFDNFHDMHIYIAFLAVFFSVMHVIGHIFNFYHICTQSSDDLNCYFREYFRASDVLASFHYWTYQTITGLTGIALVLVLVVMYVFASPYARSNVFKHFKTTHNLYIVVYILMFLHGHQRLVQQPVWPWFFLGPMVLFVLDKLVSISRNKILLPVHKATLLPSGVIQLVFKRPLTFDYHSGQWVRIACPKLGKGEYHPFTLTSAPNEEHLSLHIRAVGPWTTNLRRLFDPNTLRSKERPKIYLDGPFGESHQDWYRYSVSVLIGGGIGVTPFASILKDIASRTKNRNRLPVQKVYFIWVTRTQKSFEWMTDIIRQVEVADDSDFVDVQICITQLKEKYDLRTTMLYICERHFQKIAGVSMFTGLRAKTHFGRPKFEPFFKTLKTIHSNVDQIGIFSCGPPAMTNNVQKVCTDLNSYKGPSLIHYYENF